MLPYIHLGWFMLPTYGLFVAAGLISACFVLQADLRRRHLDADPYTIIGLIAVAGLVGARLDHLLFEARAEFFADPLRMLFSRMGYVWYGAFFGGIIVLIFLARRYRMPILQMFDACSPAAAWGYAVGRIGCLVSGDGDYGIPTSLPWGMSFPNGLVPTTERVHPTPIYEFLVGVLIAWFLWRIGAKSVRGPKATGEVFCSYLLLTGVARFLVEFIRINPRTFLGLTNAQVVSAVAVIGGGFLLWHIKRQFHRTKKEHRILAHAAAHDAVHQPEYHAPTPECPHPERWHMLDSMTAEVEVLEFLKCLVTTLKPELVVETGTFMGISTVWMAEGLKQNGFGRIITCESDPKVFAAAKKRIVESGLKGFIECRNESSLETNVKGTIDLLFSDSDAPLREKEVRRFLPQMNPNGLILMHDASSHMKQVRDAALRLEQEGLLSVLLLPTPRGLVIAQKREGRK